MRRVLAIAWLHLKEFFKSPGALVLMIVMPIMFGAIFGGMALNTEVHKPLVNIVTNGGELKAELINLLKKNDSYQWKIVSEKQAMENVENEDVVAAVVLPENVKQRMQENKPLFEVIVQRETQDYLGLVQHLNGTARTIYTTYYSVEGLDETAFPELLKSVTKIKNVNISREIFQKDDTEKEAVNLMFVGFSIMFMMFGLSGAASTILDERSGGTWARLLISPARKLEIIAGYLFSYFLMGWIQLIVLMVAMKLMFDAEWGNMVYFIPFASMVILCVVGFGLMMAGLVKTKQQAGAIGAVVIVSTSMLGGVYWSLDIVPLVMQKIALAVPQSWAMEGFEEIISGSLHTGTLLMDTGALLAFTIVFYSIGLRLIKY